ncbi:MAG: cation-transporting P-type ATPase, partial [Burkholderiales bacterium]
MDKHYVPANTGVHGASASGLTSREARERLERDGPNALATAEQRSLAAIALSVLREPMFLLLCAAAG